MARIISRGLYKISEGALGRLGVHETSRPPDRYFLFPVREREVVKCAHAPGGGGSCGGLNSGLHGADGKHMRDRPLESGRAALPSQEQRSTAGRSGLTHRAERGSIA
jgi:hypothetical protein